MMMTVSLVFGIVYNCLLFLAHARQGGMLAGGVACLALNALSVFLLLFGVCRLPVMIWLSSWLDGVHFRWTCSANCRFLETDFLLQQQKKD